MELLNKMKKKIFYYCLGSILLLFSQVVLAQTIVIHPNTIISFPKVYNNVTLDLTNGSFIIKNNASLTINNSSIIGTISPKNSVLFTVDGNGSLVMNSNIVNIHSENIPEHPTTQALQYVIQVATGKASLSGNTFSIDTPFTAGLFITTSSIPTTNIQIVNNNVSNFHGVFYLVNSHGATINNNVLSKNSYGNIVLIGNNGTIKGNTIAYAGNDHLGNSIDVIDSSTVNIANNLLLTPTCHGMYIINSNNVTIDGNRVFGGITYAMNVLTFPEFKQVPDEYLTKLLPDFKFNRIASTNITITNNYMSQNRYGVAVSDVNGLAINNNTFIQRFSDNDSRKFWTDNNILLKNVTSLVWSNNIYKEAFTQEIGGNNSKSFNLVPFPQSGGVSL